VGVVSPAQKGVHGRRSDEVANRARGGGLSGVEGVENWDGALRRLGQSPDGVDWERVAMRETCR
jgi:hypothetical protein